MSARPEEAVSAAARGRWARVRALLEEALEAESCDRETFLSEREPDAALRAEVLALLQQEGAEALRTPFEDGLAEDGTAARAEPTPVRLGPYRLLRRIGAGGMGTVHLAVRDDGQFERSVAVKLVKRGMDSEELLRRFEQERQVLASLDHPGIARLLDGGMGPDGRPYLVMEHVEGVPIDRWCDREGASVRERVELLCAVCDAVAEAHRSLVVHRDIKPSNVLVTADGRPKLLDFGIAKVLGTRHGPATAELSTTPLRMLTPTYASPEQVRGEPVTTSSDVYSLGVVLYQLLTGSPPLRFATGSRVEIERVVCTVEPERPSAALARAGEDALRELAQRRGASPRALCRALRGDLDAVVLEALRKEPRRRYASAAELAADLRRHLAGLPVKARPDRALYRAARYVRRHRALVGAGLAVLVSLVAGLLALLRSYRNAEVARAALAVQLELDRERGARLERLAADLERERAAAEGARSDAQGRLAEVKLLNVELEEQQTLAQSRLEDVRDFATRLVFDVHGALVPLEGAERARELVVSMGRSFLDRLAAESRGDASILQAAAAAYLRLGAIQLAERGPQDELMARSLDTVGRALAIGEELLALDPEGTANRFTLAAALFERGKLLGASGRHDEALADFWRCAEIAERRVGGGPDHAGTAYVRACAHASIGTALLGEGDLERAEDHLERAADELRELAARRPNVRSDLAHVGVELARLAEARGEGTRALAELEEAERLWRELLAQAPGRGEWQSGWRAARLELAGALAGQGRMEEAERFAHGVLRELEAALAGDGGSLRLRAERLLALRRCALLARSAGRTEDALELARGAVAVGRELRDRESASPSARAQLASALLLEAELALRAQQHDFAARALEEARRHLESLRESQPPSSSVRLSLSIAHGLSARLAEARAAASIEEGARRALIERALAEWNESLALADAGASAPRERDLAARARRGRERCERALAGERVALYEDSPEDDPY